MSTGEGEHIVHVPTGRGEGLRVGLRWHGFDSAVSRLAEAPCDRVEEVEGDVTAETVQAILDQGGC